MATATPSATVLTQPTFHIVVRGETLTSIARDYGITLIALENANPAIVNPSLIVVGQRLTIPHP
jgi:LysM repeat protein